MILDTCALLWLAQGGGELSATALQAIDTVLPLALGICIRSTELPAIHADPCDRMIIATAQWYHLPVVTTDPIFAQYGLHIIF